MHDQGNGAMAQVYKKVRLKRKGYEEETILKR